MVDDKIAYASEPMSESAASALLSQISFPLTSGCCVQLRPNDGSPGGARCHKHFGAIVGMDLPSWCCMTLGFPTKLDRELGVRILRGLGFNSFTFFRDVQAEFAMQYGVTRHSNFQLVP